MITTGFLDTKDKEKIAYRWYKSGYDKVVVIVHGFFNSKDSVLLTELAERLAEKHDVFIFDLRGHGTSSGLFTWISREGNELEAALDYIKDKYRTISIVGFSMGGSISINVLSRNNFNVSSFVCVSAPSDCSKIDYKWWQLDMENDIKYSLFTKEGIHGKGIRPGPFWLTKEKPINNVSKLKMPVLYIHGDKDWVVDKWHSVKLFENTVSKKHLIIVKNGPHAEYLLRNYSAMIFKEIQEWLNETEAI